MNADPVRAAAQNAAIAIPFQRFGASLFPLADVRSGFTAAPKATFIPLVRTRDRFTAARSAAGFFVAGSRDRKARPANGAIPFFLAATAPSSFAVAFQGTIYGSARRERAGWSIKRLVADFASALDAIFEPIERLAHLPIVSWATPESTNPEYAEMARQRLALDAGPMFGDVRIEAAPIPEAAE